MKDRTEKFREINNKCKKKILFFYFSFIFSEKLRSRSHLFFHYFSLASPFRCVFFYRIRHPWLDLGTILCTIMSTARAQLFRTIQYKRFRLIFSLLLMAMTLPCLRLTAMISEGKNPMNISQNGNSLRLRTFISNNHFLDQKEIHEDASFPNNKGQTVELNSHSFFDHELLEKLQEADQVTLFWKAKYEILKSQILTLSEAERHFILEEAECSYDFWTQSGYKCCDFMSTHQDDEPLHETEQSQILNFITSSNKAASEAKKVSDLLLESLPQFDNNYSTSDEENDLETYHAALKSEQQRENASNHMELIEALQKEKAMPCNASVQQLPQEDNFASGNTITDISTETHFKNKPAFLGLSNRPATVMEGGYLFPDKGGRIFNNIFYTEHALERMAPATSEIIELLCSRAFTRAKRQGFDVQENAFDETNRLTLLKGDPESLRNWWNQYGPDPRTILPSSVEAEIANPGSTDLKVIRSHDGAVITVMRKNTQQKIPSPPFLLSKKSDTDSYFQLSSAFKEKILAKKNNNFSDQNSAPSINQTLKLLSRINTSLHMPSTWHLSSMNFFEHEALKKERLRLFKNINAIKTLQKKRDRDLKNFKNFQPEFVQNSSLKLISKINQQKISLLKKNDKSSTSPLEIFLQTIRKKALKNAQIFSIKNPPKFPTNRSATLFSPRPLIRPSDLPFKIKIVSLSSLKTKATPAKQESKKSKKQSKKSNQKSKRI